MLQVSWQTAENKSHTESQKAHISSHDGMQKLNNINFTWHSCQGLPKEGQSGGNSLLYPLIFFFWLDLLFLKHIIHNISICKKPEFPMREVTVDANINLKTGSILPPVGKVKDYHLLIWLQIQVAIKHMKKTSNTEASWLCNKCNKM